MSITFALLAGVAAPSPAEAATKVKDLTAYQDARRGTATARDGSVSASATGSGTDATGDQSAGDCQGDITGYSADYTETVSLSLTAACATNPFQDHWNPGITHIVWALDVDGNGVDDFAVVFENEGGSLSSDVYALNNNTTFTLACEATPSWGGNATYATSFAASCIGSPSSFRLQAYMLFDENPFGEDCDCGEDYAPDSGFSAPVAQTLPPPTRSVESAGYTVDGWGGIHPWSVNDPLPPTPVGGPYWPDWDIARGIAVQRAGLNGSGEPMPNVWGVIVDGWGGTHFFRVPTGSSATAPEGCDHTVPPSSVVSPYWPGWDIVRGITVFPQDPDNCSLVHGLILDGWGGLHYFSTQPATAPTITGQPYWSGWDITADVVLNSAGTGGYVADGWGGVHDFAIGSNPEPPATQYGPYWVGWKIVQGITLLDDDSGGWILDGWGGIHGFDVVGGPDGQPIRPTNGDYWPNWDIARGIATLSRTPASPPT